MFHVRNSHRRGVSGVASGRTVGSANRLRLDDRRTHVEECLRYALVNTKDRSRLEKGTNMGPT